MRSGVVYLHDTIKSQCTSSNRNLPDPRGQPVCDPTAELCEYNLPDWQRVVMSEYAWDMMSSDEQRGHWLGSTVLRRDLQRSLFAVLPYLVLGDDVWETRVVDPTHMLDQSSLAYGIEDEDGADDPNDDAPLTWTKPLFQKYGRAGAAGGLFWLRTK